MHAITREAADWMLIFALRIAALLHRSRDDAADAPLAAAVTDKGFQLTVDGDWLEASPLTAAALADETSQWGALGSDLRLRKRR